MELRGMLGPVPAPVIIQADLYCLKLLVNTFGEEFLNAGIFGEGDMWANVKEKSALETEGCGMTAVIRIFVVHYRGDALGMQAVSCTEPGHSGSQDNDVWAWHFEYFSLFSGVSSCHGPSKLAGGGRFNRLARIRQCLITLDLG